MNLFKILDFIADVIFALLTIILFVIVPLIAIYEITIVSGVTGICVGLIYFAITWSIFRNLY